MIINDLKMNKNKKKKRVGRGGSHGTYATRGMKGQKSRSGSSTRIGFEGGRSGLKKQLPKIGGFKSIHPKAEVINLDMLEKHFSKEEKITPESLFERKLIKKVKNGVKILSRGEVSKELNIEKCSISKAARVKIKEKGGKIS